jgi:hypothetical protein
MNNAKKRTYDKSRRYLFVSIYNKNHCKKEISDMQYFRNMPRRTMDHPGSCASDMLPLCRNDRDERMNGTHEHPSGCGCSINENRHDHGRIGCHDCSNDKTCGDTRTLRPDCTEAGRERDHVMLNRQGICGCEDGSRDDDYGCTGLAMGFVPNQEFTELNDAEEALCRGTLFRKLDMPFYGQRRRNCK